jgi:methylmalonyl-CoA/ethylmalonyl-CoA epimerase
MNAPIGTMHHVGVIVRDLDQAERCIAGAFGLPVIRRLASPEHGMRAAFLSSGPVSIELVEFSDTEPARARLGDRLAVIDHIALAVDNIDAATDALAGHGVATVDAAPVTLPAGRVHFTRPDTSGGIIWQLLELVASPSVASSAGPGKEASGAEAG